jgi:hypothetical protein
MKHLVRAGMSQCYFCSPGEYSSGQETQKLILAQLGAYNMGSCSGVYVYDPLNRVLNGKPIFVNPSGNRFVGWGGGSMRCSDLGWLEQAVASQGYFNSYSGNQYSTDVTCCWPYYTAILTPPGD